MIYIYIIYVLSIVLLYLYPKKSPKKSPVPRNEANKRPIASDRGERSSLAAGCRGLAAPKMVEIFARKRYIWATNYGKSTMFNGKIHYFYGHYQ